MYLPGGDLPLGNHILPAPHYFSASAFRAAEQMLDLPQFVPGAVSHAGIFLYFGISDPSIHRWRGLDDLCG